MMKTLVTFAVLGAAVLSAIGLSSVSGDCESDLNYVDSIQQVSGFPNFLDCDVFETETCRTVVTDDIEGNAYQDCYGNSTLIEYTRYLDCESNCLDLLLPTEATSVYGEEDSTGDTPYCDCYADD